LVLNPTLSRKSVAQIPGQPAAITHRHPRFLLASRRARA
jgi:hypothetical protein